MRTKLIYRNADNVQLAELTVDKYDGGIVFYLTSKVREPNPSRFQLQCPSIGSGRYDIQSATFELAKDGYTGAIYLPYADPNTHCRLLINGRHDGYFISYG